MDLWFRKHRTLRRDLEDYLQREYVPETPHLREEPLAAPDLLGYAPSRKECSRAPAAYGELEDLLKQTDAGFTETLLYLIDRSGRKDSDIYTRANVSRQHFSKIRSNPDYKPTKPTAVAFAIALGLDLEQTRDLIGRAGFALTNSSRFDVIVRFYIEKRCYDIHTINKALYDYDQPLLGAKM